MTWGRLHQAIHSLACGPPMLLALQACTSAARPICGQFWLPRLKLITFASQTALMLLTKRSPRLQQQELRCSRPSKQHDMRLPSGFLSQCQSIMAKPTSISGQQSTQGLASCQAA